MNVHASKKPENKNLALVNTTSQRKKDPEAVQFTDNRAEAVTQRKLQEVADNNPVVKQLKKFQDMASNFSSQQFNPLHQHKKTHDITNTAPLQRKVFKDDMKTVELTFDEFWKIGIEYGIREKAALFAIYESSTEYTINEAITNVLSLQHENEMRLTQDFGYDSDDLSDIEIDPIEDISMKRKKHNTPGVVMHMEDTVKSLARTKRRMLGKRSTPNDMTPIVSDTTGGHRFEFTPNKFRKDMGVYNTEESKDGSISRSGGANKYEALGKKMDKTVKILRIGFAQANQLIIEGFEGRDLTEVLGEHAAIFGELIGVLMSDMARGSGARDLIITMLSENTSFTSRLKEGGTYAPASTGGTKFIRAHTDSLKQ